MSVSVKCSVEPGMFSDEVVAHIGERVFIVGRDHLIGEPGPDSRIRVSVIKGEQGRRWVEIPTAYKVLMPLDQVELDETA